MNPPQLSYCISNIHLCYQPCKVELSFYQPVSIWFTIWQVSSHQQHSLIFYQNRWNNVRMCRNKCRMISFGSKKVALIRSNYSVDIAMLAHKFHQLATVTSFTWQLVKCTIWQKYQNHSSCYLKNTAYRICLW